jgi:hypothetical protein
LNQGPEARASLFDVAAAMRRVLERGRSSSIRLPALIAAIVVFVAGLVLSVTQLPHDLRQVAPSFLLLSALCVPAIIGLNAVETKLSATFAGATFGWLQATHIGLVSSAANMLPLPGGPLVRIGALKLAGASLLQGSVATTLIAAIGLGLAFACAGASTVLDRPFVGMTFLAAGGIASAACAIALFRLRRSWRLVAMVLLAKSAGTAVGLLRMYFALASLGLLVPFRALCAFAVSDVAGSVVSIVPAGLGVNEAVAALMAALVAVPPTVAFLAVGINRVIALAVLAVTTALVAALRGARQRQDREHSA